MELEEEITKQCIQWASAERLMNSSGIRAQTRESLEVHFYGMSPAKFELFSIAQVKKKKDYIFFIRKRELMGDLRRGRGEWRYLGDFFEFKDGEVKYITTSSFIPEESIVLYIGQ